MAAQVGIVLVSHSAALAEGAAELAGQVGGGGVVIAAAGGTADGRLGTSAEKVAAAVRRASGGVGVLILPDLGSAVLTVKALLTDIEDDEIGAFGPLGPVEVADAPFVEGAVAAAVIAAAGAPLAAVRAAAEEARHARKL
jgi:phosphoenolpyruvate---glycerone phosphotransferase subunit DhaM